MSGQLASPSCPAPPRWVTVLVLAVAALAFLPTLTGGFLADDFVYIVRFRELPWSAWPALFTHDWSAGIWGQPLRELRPFAALSFMSDAKLFGGHALGYRLTNLALHLISTAFVARLAWRYAAGSMAAALVAGLIFAVHPAHAEAVSWITGRVDLLATCAALLFWFAAEIFVDHGCRRHVAVALAAFFIGIFSKELCMFAPLLLLLRWVLLDRDAGRTAWLRRAAVFGGVAAIFIVYAFARRAAFGHDNIGYNLWTDAPAWHRQAAHWGWLVPLLPFTGRQEWAATPPLATLHAIWLAALALVLGGLVWALLRGARRTAAVLFFGGVWFFVTVFPLTGVVYFSPRHLYFPTVGLALAVGLACAGARWRAVTGGVLVAWCAFAHVAAVRPWQRAAALSRDALAALDREVAAAAPGVLVLTAAPETFGSVLFWAWSSPECVGAPFLAHPLAPDRVIERPANYRRSDTWMADRKPFETMRAAPEAIALFVGDDGRVFCRRVPGPQFHAAVEKLAAGAFTPETLTEWVKSLAQP
jgi:hypothetical protein